jgi:hypothetical protein
MNFSKLILTITLTIGLCLSSVNLFAHGPGSGGSEDGLMVTRHFTGAWEQVDQESQGLSLEVIEQADGSRRAVAYWYTYGTDRKTAWYLGIGDLVDDRIEFELYDSVDVGFMQPAQPDNESVQSIGTMTIVFDNCDSGSATFDTSHEEVGSGSFTIGRVSSVMNTYCSGGISDDMHADGMFGEQRLALSPAREGITGSGHARYEGQPGHMEFEVEFEGLPDGDFDMYVGMEHRGIVSVFEGRGNLEFTSPHETGSMMLNFDPREQLIEIHDNQGVMLSSFENSFEAYGQSHHGEGYDHHYYDCQNGSGGGMGGGMGGNMGGGMMDCVEDGEFIQIEVDLVNTGVLADAKGEVEWNMNAERVEFSVEIEDVPIGSYTLKVGGVTEGIIEAFEMHTGEVYGRIRFRDPEAYGREHLDFEPRGQTIEILQGDNTILKVEFPSE